MRWVINGVFTSGVIFMLSSGSVHSRVELVQPILFVRTSSVWSWARESASVVMLVMFTEIRVS